MAGLRLTVVMVSLVLALLLGATSGQFRGQILDLQVVGGDSTKGYVQATVLYGNGSVATGPVCGAVTGSAAYFACYSLSLLASNKQGTVDGFVGISLPTSVPVVSNLACNSYSNNNGQVTYGCSFSSSAMCDPGQSAAVSCNLNGGQLAAIILACILVFSVVLTGGILLCVFGCCPKQTVCYHFIAARRDRRSRRAAQPQAHMPTSYQPPLEQAVLSELEPPSYLDSVSKGNHDSSPPPYKQ